MKRLLGGVVLAALCAMGAATGCSSDDSDSSGSSGSSGSAGASGSSGGGEAGALNGITAAHNAARDNVSPAAATPIPHLAWSSTIAATAQAYAEQCVFSHSGGQYGENLYATTGSATAQDVVDSWVGESASYDYASNSCSATCGHYTQVVWASSTNLGCGVANCTTNSPFGGGAWQIWVCNYDPPGNYVGESPY